ncbi:MAG: PAS domain S-box protein, partial [Patescibacteria group bacterium]|nr:PAS domain S-box protein [Patescibacteria group bacterium]
LTGWRDAEARGRSIANVFHILDTASREKAVIPAWAALNEDRVLSLANGTSLVARDGTERQIADSCAPIHDDAGKVVGAVLVFRDVTKEYGQREALRTSEEKYRALVENANDIIYSLDQDGVFTYLSPNWTQLVGYGVNEGQGTSFRLYVHPEDVGKCSEFFQAVIETGEPHAGVEYRVRHKDGHWRWHRSNAAALRDAAGRVIEYIGIARDVTDQKEAEEAIRLAKEEAEQHVIALKRVNLALERLRGMAEAASRSKSEFLANMSHEIRTPITAILGYADILIDESDGPTARDRAAVIKRNGEHLLGLINDILDLSKIEAGKMTAERTACSPRGIVAEVVSLMRVRAEEKQLTLHVDLADALPETILTDPLRLRQILVNLVGNAIKFTDRGEVHIAVRRTRGDACDQLAFEIRDTGIGMSLEQMATLFQPFSQADTSAARKFGGTGLGLAISRRLAEALGGGIEVRSTPGEGSTFTVTIDPGPLHGVATVRQQDDGQCAGEMPAEPSVEIDVRLPVRILLAEDGADNRRLLMLLLQKAGAEVTAVEDGLTAVEVAMASRYAKRPFDLILMDMQMPVMDGYAATRLLREKNYFDPIVALTAHAMADDRQKCLDAGCDDYLTKPIDRKRLLQVASRWTLVQQISREDSLAAK